MAEYFGPEYRRKEWEVQVPTPVGELCALCEEPIQATDTGTYMTYLDLDTGPYRRPEHYECSLRRVIGSVAHVRGTCGCNVPGSSDLDPEGMTKREAAIAAVRAWEERQ